MKSYRRSFEVSALLIFALAGSSSVLAQYRRPVPAYGDHMQECVQFAMPKEGFGSIIEKAMGESICHCRFERLPRGTMSKEDFFSAANICEAERSANPAGFVQRYYARINRSSAQGHAQVPEPNAVTSSKKVDGPSAVGGAPSIIGNWKCSYETGTVSYGYFGDGKYVRRNSSSSNGAVVDSAGTFRQEGARLRQVPVAARFARMPDGSTEDSWSATLENANLKRATRKLYEYQVGGSVSDLTVTATSIAQIDGSGAVSDNSMLRCKRDDSLDGTHQQLRAMSSQFLR